MSAEGNSSDPRNVSGSKKLGTFTLPAGTEIRICNVSSFELLNLGDGGVPLGGDPITIKGTLTLKAFDISDPLAPEVKLSSDAITIAPGVSRSFGNPLVKTIAQADIVVPAGVSAQLTLYK